MNKGYNRIFWGILITTFHINIEGIQILPNFIGYMVMVSGIGELYNNSKNINFKSAIKYGYYLSVLSLLGLILSSDQSNILRNTTSLVIEYNIFSLVQLIMIYKVFNGSIECISFQVNKEKAKSYEKLFKYFIIYYIVVIIVRNFNMVFNNEKSNIIVIWMLLIIQGFNLLIMNKLRKEEYVCNLEFKK